MVAYQIAPIKQSAPDSVPRPLFLLHSEKAGFALWQNQTIKLAPLNCLFSLCYSAFSFLASIFFSCAFFNICLILRLSLNSCYCAVACEGRCFEELIQLKSSLVYLVVADLSVNGTTSCVIATMGMQSGSKQ